MLARLGSRLGHARRGPARGLLLEIVAFDADTAARGVSERLLGLAGETVEPNTVNEEQSGYCERASLSAYGQRALTQKRTLGAGAHLSLEILVSLRTAASAEAPSAPMSLYAMLQRRGRMGTVRE